jgi:O-6-methylguanine DNA methyltransferase
MLEIRKESKVYFSKFNSPIGKIFIVKTKEGIFKVSFESKKKKFVRQLKNQGFKKVIERKDKFRGILRAFEKYFRGEKINFNFKINLTKLTPFQRKVLLEVKKIPYGKTKTYKEIGKIIGKEKGFQAIGKAISKNPILIIIPCHRVVRSDGKLGGFSFGSELKKKLLEIEKIKGLRR